MIFNRSKNKRISENHIDIAELRSQIDKMGKRKIPYETVSCNVCGCLVDRDFAVRGKGVIRSRPTYNWNRPTEKTDYIHYPYYCRLHKPKEKKTKEKKK